MRRAVLAMGIAAACLAPASGQQRVTHAQALARLKAGNQRFVHGESRPKPIGEGVRRTLASGERPYAIIVTSSDSRVVPEHVFNAGLGELFVIRTAGNVCDPHTLASIEYAAETLGTELCVVLAVEGCSAVRLAARNPDKHESRAVSELAERIGPALRLARREGLVGEDMLARAEAENAYNTALECLQRSRSLRRLRQSGHFRILAARYRSADGHVDWLPERHFADKTHIRPHHRRKLRGLSPHVALRMLQAGHRRFLSPARPTGDISAERRRQMARSNEAIAVVVTCSDSRVAPEHLFDAGLGELYVVRVAGNTINAQALASIEHAMANTGASVCVVLGHSNCGVVATAIRHAHNSNLSPSMRHLLHKIEPAVEIARQRNPAPENLQGEATKINVLRALVELRSRSAFLSRLEKEGRCTLLGALYRIETGNIRWLDDDEAGNLPAPKGGPDADVPLPDTSRTTNTTITNPPVPDLPVIDLPTENLTPKNLPATPSEEPLPKEPQTVTPVPESRIRFEPFEPSPSIDETPQARSRAFVLTLLSAILVAAACLLAFFLWTRRHADSEYEYVDEDEEDVEDEDYFDEEDYSSSR